MSVHVCADPIAGVMKAISSALTELPPAIRQEKLDELVWLYYLIADHDLLLQPKLHEIWPNATSHGEIASRVLGRLSEFPFNQMASSGLSIGREAIEGLMLLVIDSGVGNLSRRQGKLAITTLFNRTILDTPKLTALLRLMKEVADGVTTDEARTGLLKLIRNLNTGSDVKGVWYQLRYMRDVIGLDKVKAVEFERPSSHRGIDITDADGNFYELKGGPGLLSKAEAEQILKQMSEAPISDAPDGWRRYRHVSNGTTDNHAGRDSGRFLAYLWRVKSGDLPPPGSLADLPAGMKTLLAEFEAHIRGRYPDINFQQFMDANAPELLGTDLDAWQPTDPAHLGPIQDAQAYLADKMFFRHEIPEIHEVGTAGVPIPP